MLVELRVRSLGVIEDATLELGPGMTALTGETGAGKTLVAEALELLVGGRPDPSLVRSGASEAIIEGRFHDENETETVLARTLPAAGRSRAWVDGRMATQAELAEAGARLVDLHGQHAHQSLLDPASQRAALDEFASLDPAGVRHARTRARAIEDEISRFGGDELDRARQTEYLRHQLGEIASASITGPGEDEDLREEQERLSDASALRQAAASALSALDGEYTGALDGLGLAVAQLEGRAPLAKLTDRARGLQAEIADLAADLRRVAETWEDDPERLAEVSQRRAVLAELRRKYGTSLKEVIAYAEGAETRLMELESTQDRVVALEVELEVAKQELSSAQRLLRRARVEAAPRLASLVETHLRALAMPAARLEVCVGDDPSGDDVVVLLSANPGEGIRPLGKVASGGELARAMLALRLVVAPTRPTLVFDEVDAGIGGSAADAVGRALSSVAESSQVLVVTHLPQVAAMARQHLVVEKQVAEGRTRATVRPLKGLDRVVELARMLSGRPESGSARRHAKELLDEAGHTRRPRKVGSQSSKVPDPGRQLD